jgi:hypothetical protein
MSIFLEALGELFEPFVTLIHHRYGTRAAWFAAIGVILAVALAFGLLIWWATRQ